MQRLIVLVGVPASGKSTIAENIKDESFDIHSSDAIRKELYGSEQILGNPAEIFNLMYKRTLDSLNSGKNVIYDSTNISRKDRIRLLNFISKINNLSKECIIAAATIDTIFERNKNRERKVPENVILNMLKNFNMPLINEGFDNITVVNTSDLDDCETMIDKYCKNLTHDNPHHTLDVDKHMHAALDYLKNNYPNEYNDYVMKNAVLLHDIGKGYAKTFLNSKNIVTEVAHYYGHAGIGAYMLLSANFRSEEERIKIATLVNFHMRPLEAWLNSNKAELNDRRLLGEELYHDIKIINDCDCNADSSKQ